MTFANLCGAPPHTTDKHSRFCRAEPEAAPLIKHAHEVEKLAHENEQLEIKLAEMQRRLEAAEAKRAALEMKKDEAQ